MPTGGGGFDTWAGQLPAVQVTNTGDFSTWLGAAPVAYLGPPIVTANKLLPVEFRGLAALLRDALLPEEFRGLAAVLRDALLPVDWSSTTIRDALLPIDWGGTLDRSWLVPVELQGLDPNVLLHRWLDLVKLGAPFLHAWSVHALPQLFALLHQWNVKEQPFPPLIHVWNVVGDIYTPFGFSPATGDVLPTPPGGPAPGDIQRPTTAKDKIP